MTPYWTRVIQNAKRREAAGNLPFTDKHSIKALRWCTCACGKQDPRIPRHDRAGKLPRGMPKDNILASLGSDFFSAIYGQNPHGAEKILGEIEKRAAEILAKGDKK